MAINPSKFFKELAAPSRRQTGSVVRVTPGGDVFVVVGGQQIVAQVRANDLSAYSAGDEVIVDSGFIRGRTTTSDIYVL